MERMKKTPSDAGHERALTLLEILIVLAILVVLFVFGSQALVGIQGSFQLSQAGQELRSAFSEARLASIARNRILEVRLCLPDDDEIQPFVYVVEYSRDGDVTLHHRVKWFPSGIGFRQEEGWSSLLSRDRSRGDVELPKAGSNYAFVPIVFRPDGTTALADQTATDSQRHFVTLARPDAGDALDANFYTIEIDPHNGTVNSFRP